MIAGPCCVLLSIAVSTLLPTPNGIYFPWLALAGLALSWKFSLRGLMASLILAMIASYLGKVVTIWDLGIYASLALAWTAIALAVDREIHRVEPTCAAAIVAPITAPIEIETPAEPRNEQIPQQQKELIEQQQSELRAQQSLLERMRNELVAQVEKNRESALAATQLQVQRQITADLEIQVIDVQKEAIQHRQDAQKYKGLHNQLREQFERKSLELDETRQRVFQVEEELNALLSEINESENSAKTPWLRDLEQLLEYSESLYEEELTRLRRENALLEELVTRGRD